MNNDSRARYEMTIRPTSGWLEIDLIEIWRRRDLLFLLIYRDFASKYRQTVLGPIWFVIQPLLMSFVFAIFFGGVARIPTEGVPPILFYLAGLLGWNYFAQTFQSTASTLVANAGMFGKVYFPRLIVPLSTVVANFLAFGLQLAVLLMLWAYFKFSTPGDSSFELDRAIVWFPLVVIQLAALSLGAGLWVSALTAKYRDFTYVVPFLVQVWMYATPVIYPLSRVPERWRWAAALNPMTVPTESIKLMFLGAGHLMASDVALSVSTTLLLLFLGALAFNRVQKTFVDTI